MSGAAPLFWKGPIRYWRWAANHKPALFYTGVMVSITPFLPFVIPPIRHYFGDTDPPPIPMTYPIPKGPRKIPEGYDDP